MRYCPSTESERRQESTVLNLRPYICNFSRDTNWSPSVYKYGTLPLDHRLRYLHLITYRGADKSLTRPTSRCILFDGENISLDASLVIWGGAQWRNG